MANAIGTDVQGYAFLRDVSAPLVITVIEGQTELIAGARANSVKGTLGGVQTADLHFFDIPTVGLTTGTADDRVTLGARGLKASGLRNFTLRAGAGNDTVDLLSDQLTPPDVDQFQRDGAGVIAEVTGEFRYDGGSGVNTLGATFNADWTLDSTRLTAGNGERVELADVRDVRLTGGAGINRLTVNNWGGSAVLDGGANSDEFEVSASALDVVTLADAGGTLDQLTLVGTGAADNFTVNTSTVHLGTKVLDYTGIEVVSIAGGGGDDTLAVIDAGAGAARRRRRLRPVPGVPGRVRGRRIRSRQRPAAFGHHRRRYPRSPRERGRRPGHFHGRRQACHLRRHH